MAEHPSQYQHQAGAKLKYSLTGNSGGWITIDDLVSYEAPELQRGDIPASTLTTPQKVMRKKPGWINPGTFPFVVILTADQYGDLYNWYLLGTNLYWMQIYPPDDSGPEIGVNIFRGYISRFKPGATFQRENEQLVELNMTVTVSGLGRFDGDAADFFAVGTGTD